MEIQIQQNVDLKTLCTYGTGGKARFFAGATRWEEMLGLREFAKHKNIPFLIIGGGSNVLFADEGYPGLVIRNGMKKMQVRESGVITVESGVHVMEFLLLAAQHNLGGLSGLANVPGSVGGAIYGNAGIPGCHISDRLLEVTLLQENLLTPTRVAPDYFEFSYRDSRIKKTKDIVLSASFKLEPMPRTLTRREMEGYIKERAKKQPPGKTCGSFFKNPSEFPSAGWLIEQAGCKGMAVGGAQVSEKHANFIMNAGGATSGDITRLALKVHDIVLKKFNVKLEPEVQIFPVNPFK